MGVSRWVAEGEQQFVFSRVQGSGQDGVDGPAEDHTGDKQGEQLGCCLHTVTVSPTLAAWFLLAQGRYGVPDVSTALTSPNVTSTSDTCFSFWFQIKVRLPVSGSPAPVSPRMRRRAAAWTSSPSSCGRAARRACCGTTRPSWTTGRRARPCCPKMTISRCV